MSGEELDAVRKQVRLDALQDARILIMGSFSKYLKPSYNPRVDVHRLLREACETVLNDIYRAEKETAITGTSSSVSERARKRVA
jgi:hypothetical protein